MNPLIDKHGRTWTWDPRRNAYLSSDPSLANGVCWSRQTLETVFGPVKEGEDPTRQLATDFIDAARLRLQGEVERAIDILMPLGLNDADAHLRVHLLAAIGALLTGGAASKHLGEPPDDGSFYQLDIDQPEPGQDLPADKILAARLMTLGANLDKDVIRDLITASCSVGGDGCALLTSAVIELVALFGSLTGGFEVTL